MDTSFIHDVMGVNEEGVTNEQIFDLSQEWLRLRLADEAFALDCMERAKMRKSLDAAWNAEDSETILKILAMTDTDKIGLMGHSLGGASSVTLARQRSDIDAVVDLDGTMLGEIVAVENGKNIYNEETYKIPVLEFMKEMDDTDREQYRKEPDIRQYLLRLALQLILIQAEVMLLIAPPADGSVSHIRFTVRWERPCWSSTRRSC